MSNELYSKMMEEMSKKKIIHAHESPYVVDHAAHEQGLDNPFYTLSVAHLYLRKERAKQGYD